MSVGTRNPRIDLIRGISILLVLFHHFNIAYPLNDTFPVRFLGWKAVRALARNGNYGVTMFFVISGYLITSNAERRWSKLGAIDARAFYGLRVARIVPCLVLLLAVVNTLALTGIPIFQNHAPEGTTVSLWLVNLASLTFWMNVLIGAHGWVNYSLGVLWSLSVEEVFYLSFPILCLTIRRESRLLAFWAVIILVGPLYRLAHQGNEGGFLYAYFASFDGIAIGCCTAVVAKRVSLKGHAATVARAGAAAIMVFLYLYRPINETNVLGVTVMALGTAILVLAANTGVSAPASRLGPIGSGIGWLGKLSYELYLFHLIVLGAMRTVCPPSDVGGDEKSLLLIVFILVSMALSVVVARLYAEPLNRVIRQHLVKSRRATVNG